MKKPVALPATIEERVAFLEGGGIPELTIEQRVADLEDRMDRKANADVVELVADDVRRLNLVGLALLAIAALAMIRWVEARGPLLAVLPDRRPPPPPIAASPRSEPPAPQNGAAAVPV